MKEDKRDAPKPRMSASFTQPTFLKDESIGHLLPEGKERDGSKEDQTNTTRSMDLDKSIAHAISLLGTRPNRWIKRFWERFNDRSL